MLLSMPFKLELYNLHPDKIDEYIVKYDSEKHTLEKIIEFLQAMEEENPDIWIDIEILDNELKIKELETLSKIYPKLKFRLNSKHIKQIDDNIDKMPFKYYLKDVYVNSYSVLKLMLDRLQVSDIYIADDLCYNLPEISQYLKKNNVQTRLILNKIPSLIPGKGRDPSSPIFCPQDKKILDKYIDIAEFECGDPFDIHRFNVYYKIWFETQTWIGDIRSINEDLEIPIPNSTLFPNFTESKIRCRRKCALKNGCRKCYDYVLLAKELNEEGYYLKQQGENELK